MDEAAFVGRVDGVIEDHVEGWALPLEQSEAAVVELRIDGEVCGKAVSDGFRQDLHDAGLRKGYARFFLQIPKRFRDGREHVVTVENLSVGRTLEPRETTFRLERKLDQRRKLIREIQFRTDRREFLDKVRQKRRVAVIAAFGNGGKLCLYLRQMVQELRDLGCATLLVFAEGARESGDHIRQVDGLDGLVKRNNVGYDFGSWATGLDMLDGVLGDLDDLILINDSNFGAIAELRPALEDTGAESICLTDSYEHVYHAQSYFLRLRRDALHNGAVREFFGEFDLPVEKADAISAGELALTRELVASGLPLKALFPYEDVAGAWLDRFSDTADAMKEQYDRLEIPRGKRFEQRIEILTQIAEHVMNNVPMNPTHFFWRTLVTDFGHPLVKRELVARNPANVPDVMLALATPAVRQVLNLEHVAEYAKIEGGCVPFPARPTPATAADTKEELSLGETRPMVMTAAGARWRGEGAAS